jgi:hypothetical protein
MLSARGRTSLLIAAAAVVAIASNLAAQPTYPKPPPPPLIREGDHDFDRLIGSWTGRHRRVPTPAVDTSRNAGEVGVARLVVRRLAGGPALLAEYELLMRDSTSLRRVTLMVYSPATHLWTLQPTNVTTGELEPPLTGAFAEQRGAGFIGEFFRMREYQGRVLLERESWRTQGIDSATSQRAFSADGGRTWEANWSGEFTRVADASPDARPARDDPRAASPRRDTAVAPGQRGSLRSDGNATDEWPAAVCCALLEMRRYDIAADREQALIDIFERENEEARGMSAFAGTSPESPVYWRENVALLRDLDRPGVYLWLTGFADPYRDEQRRPGFAAVWTRHVESMANAGAALGDAYVLTDGNRMSKLVLADRPVRPADPKRTDVIVATAYHLKEHPPSPFGRFFVDFMLPRISEAGARPVGAVFTWGADVPVFQRVADRGGVPDTRRVARDDLFVWFARFPNVTAYETYEARLARDARWTSDVLLKLENQLALPAQVWRTVPVGRSRPIL